MLKKLLLAVAVVALASTANAQVVWEETFDAVTDLPAGWSQSTVASDGGWKIGTAAGLSSQYFGFPARPGKILGTNDDGCNCDKSADVVKTGAVSLVDQAGKKLYLIFDAFHYAATYQGATESLTVQISKDGGATWTDLGVVDGGGGWQNSYNYDISAYAGQTVQIAFSYNDGGDWLYGAGIDNIKIAIPDNVLRAKLSGVSINRYLDVIPDYISGYQKIWTGEKMYLSGTVENPGYVPITSFDVTWKRGAETHTENVTNANVAILAGTFSFLMDAPADILAGANDFEVSISNINGGADNDPTDNVGTVAIAGVTPVKGRKVVMEEGTGTWCGWCPRGTVLMNYLEDTYGANAVTIAVHNADPMVVSAYDTGAKAFISGYPSGGVDRVNIKVDPSTFERWYVERMTVDPLAVVTQDVAYDDVTRKATVTSKVKFLSELNGDYRILVVFTEDDVTGTGSTWEQTNYYAGGQVGPMGGFENLPASVADIDYDHVARALVGGIHGKSGSLPAANPAGSTASYVSEWTIPAGQNPNKMHAITMLLKKTTSSSEVVNAESTKVPFQSVGVNDLNTKKVAVSMYPNPVQDAANITMKLEETSDVMIRIVDAVGKVVVERNYANVSGEQVLPFRVGDLPNGSYTLTATAQGQTAAKQFVIAR